MPPAPPEPRRGRCRRPRRSGAGAGAGVGRLPPEQPGWPVPGGGAGAAAAGVAADGAGVGAEAGVAGAARRTVVPDECDAAASSGVSLPPSASRSLRATGVRRSRKPTWRFADLVQLLEDLFAFESGTLWRVRRPGPWTRCSCLARAVVRAVSCRGRFHDADVIGGSSQSPEPRTVTGAAPVSPGPASTAVLGS